MAFERNNCIIITLLSSFRFLERLDGVIACKEPVTLVLDDPAGNSFVQSLTDDYADDKRLKIHKYTRNYDQNEELGLNDMKVENYENDDKRDLDTIKEE